MLKKGKQAIFKQKKPPEKGEEDVSLKTLKGIWDIAVRTPELRQGGVNLELGKKGKKEVSV